MSNVFIKPLQDYKMDSGPVKQYIEQTTLYISKKTGKTLEESKELALKILKKKDTRNPEVTFNHRGDNGDVTEETTTMSNYLEDNLRNNYLVVPSLTAYEDKEKDASLHSAFLSKNIKSRNIDKKKAFQYKQEGNKVLHGRYNTLQKSRKIANNAMSGSYASISTILYNPSAHYSLTSTCRMATSIANAITESMAAGNKHYRNVKLVLNNIIGTIHILDLSLIEKMLIKYNLYRPTVDDVYKSILRSTRLYWNDVQGEKTIKDLLLTLTDIELSAVLYVNDIYHLRVYNDSFMREFIDVLSMRIENNTDKPLEVLENSEEFVLNLVHHICADDIKGKKVNYKDMVNTPELKVLGSTALNINITLAKYEDLLQTFFRNDVMPINVSEIRDMLRRVTVLSDTDSTCASYGEWVEWFLGENLINAKATAVSASVMTIASQVLEHKLRQYSANMNIPTELLDVISYKGEFYWTLFCNTPVAKHYHASVAIQEGNVFAKPDLEIKGVNLINSNSPMFVQKITQDTMKDIHFQLNNNKKVDLLKYLTIGANLEREIISKLMAGDIEILKTSKIKEAAGYKLEAARSPYIHHMFWEEVMLSKYGEIGKPPYTAVKIPTTLKSKRKMNEFVEKITDDGVKIRFREFLTKYSKEVIGTFNIPLIYVGEHGIPDELREAIDINRVVFDALSAFYMVLSTIGFSRKEGMKLLDLGY